MHIHLSPRLNACVDLPTSKSISARALIINALAAAPCTLQGLSDCDDTQAMLSALDARPDVIDVGAAGTAMRFLTAYCATREGEDNVLTGTQRMQQRPIGILVDALRSLGAEIDYLAAPGYPPLRIRGRKLQGGAVTVEAGISSQYISALMMIGPTLAQGLQLQLEGTIASRPYIEMTRSLMQQFGAEVAFEGQTISVAPGSYRRSEAYSVEPDWSAASYWFELVALSPDADARVLLPGLQAASLQGDSICARYFEALGVATAFTSEGALLTKAASPAASASASADSPPLNLDFSACPDLAQTFVVTAALLGRPFRFDGLQSLKIKETDRMAALVAELSQLGYILTEEDGSRLCFDGTVPAAPASTSCRAASASAAPAASDSAPSIATYDDHRMAMAFAPAAYRFPGLNIEHPEVVSKSYPSFWQSLPLI